MLILPLFRVAWIAMRLARSRKQVCLVVPATVQG